MILLPPPSPAFSCTQLSLPATFTHTWLGPLVYTCLCHHLHAVFSLPACACHVPLWTFYPPHTLLPAVYPLYLHTPPPFPFFCKWVFYLLYLQDIPLLVLLCLPLPLPQRHFPCLPTTTYTIFALYWFICNFIYTCLPYLPHVCFPPHLHSQFGSWLVVAIFSPPPPLVFCLVVGSYLPCCRRMPAALSPAACMYLFFSHTYYAWLFPVLPDSPHTAFAYAHYYFNPRMIPFSVFGLLQWHCPALAISTFPCGPACHYLYWFPSYLPVPLFCYWLLFCQHSSLPTTYPSYYTGVVLFHSLGVLPPTPHPTTFVCDLVFPLVLTTTICTLRLLPTTYRFACSCPHTFPTTALCLPYYYYYLLCLWTTTLFPPAGWFQVPLLPTFTFTCHHLVRAIIPMTPILPLPGGGDSSYNLPYLPFLPLVPCNMHVLYAYWEEVPSPLLLPPSVPLLERSVPFTIAQEDS